MKLTPKQAAEKAGVSLSLIYALCHERRLRHYRVGGNGKRGKILIEESDLESLFEKCAIDSTGNEEKVTKSSPRSANQIPLKHIQL
jgi:excisionase family DNA binding protein